jgi:hypothetical protein
MVSYVRVMIAPDKYESFQVPYAVSVYIKQLEWAVKYPEKSKLKALYYPRLEPREDNPVETPPYQFKQEY